MLHTYMSNLDRVMGHGNLESHKILEWAMESHEKGP